MDRRVLAMVVLMTVGALGLPSLGQQQQQPSELNTRPEQPSIFAGEGVAAQSDADVARLTSMLEGSWKSTAAVGQGEDARVLWMHMRPFETDMLGRAIYVEVHEDGTPWEPVRQAIFRVYRFGDTLRLRTYEFREPSRADVLASLWLAGDDMPMDSLRPGDLIPTMDLAFERAANGYEGATPHAYPTAESGAVEMRVRMRARPDRLVTHETFSGLDGSAREGDGEITWERATLPATVDKGEDGLVVITLEAGKTDGPPTDEGDVLFINYEGFRADGFKFDSSWDRGLALRTVYPPRVIGGFKKGLEPMVEGMRRKLIIPPALGYGDTAVQGIPPGSTLVFHIHVVRVEQADPIPMEERIKRQERP
jgi:hypothetical protein